MFDPRLSLADFDPELAAAIAEEARRQEDHIELIASENYTSPAVMEAQGSKLTNKYAEGYPGKRYYGGCEYVDKAEELAMRRLRELFDAAYVNVQPHSGSQANAAVYMALLQPGDRVLGMNLSEGGHLTHGSPVNFSGKLFDVAQYGVDHETGLIDYEAMREQALSHRPKMIIGGFSAYSRIVDWEKMRAIADEVGAWLFVDMAHVAGLVAAGVYPSPLPFADVVTSTTHKTLRGPRGGIILAREETELSKKFNSLVFPGTQGGPLMHVIAAKAVAFKEAAEEDFREYQQRVVDNARVLAATLIKRGYKVVSGGTDNHLALLDLTDKGITGKDGEAALGAVNITVNKNTVPGEKRSPFVTSGLRLGTPAVTTRGFGRDDCARLGHLIADVLDAMDDPGVAAKVAAEASELCRRYPVYQA